MNNEQPDEAVTPGNNDRSPNDHKKFMAEAIALSKRSVETGGGPFGAVIVKSGEIIGRGTNQVTNQNDPTMHGEIVAIREACAGLGSFQLDGCVIYSTCEPCPMCLSAIYWARLDEVYYGNTRDDAASIGFDDVLIYEEITAPEADRQRPSHQLMRDEALSVMKLWFEKEDKVPY